MDLILVGLLIFVVIRWNKLSKIREEYYSKQIDLLDKKLEIHDDMEVV